MVVGVQYAAQQCFQCGALGRGERIQQRLLRSAGGAVQFVEEQAAGRGERDAMAAAILLIGCAGREAGGLQMVDTSAEVALVDPEAPCDLLLRLGTEVAECGEDRVVAKGQAMAVQRDLESAGSVPGHLRRQIRMQGEE